MDPQVYLVVRIHSTPIPSNLLTNKTNGKQINETETKLETTNGIAIRQMPINGTLIKIINGQNRQNSKTSIIKTMISSRMVLI